MLADDARAMAPARAGHVYTEPVSVSLHRAIVGRLGEVMRPVQKAQALR